MAKRTKKKTAKKDPIYVDGIRLQPIYIDYKDVDLLSKLTNRHGKIVSRRYAGESTYYLVRLEGGGQLKVSAGVWSGEAGDRVGVVLRHDGPLPRVFTIGETSRS